MPRPALTEEYVRMSVDSMSAGRYALVAYGGASTKLSTFKDTSTGYEFTITYSVIKKHLTKDPNYRFQAGTPYQRQRAQVQELSEGRYDLLDYNSYGKRALFKEIATGRLTSITVAAAIHHWKKDPSYKIGQPARGFDEAKQLVHCLSEGQYELTEYTDATSEAVFTLVETGESITISYPSAILAIKKGKPVGYRVSDIVNANRVLDKLTNGLYKITEYGDATTPAKFINTSTGQEYTHSSVRSILSTVRKNPDHEFSNNSIGLEQHSAEILELSNGRYTLKEYDSNTGKGILQCEDGSEFDRYVANVKRALRQNKDHVFGANIDSPNNLEGLIENTLKALKLDYLWDTSLGIPGVRYRPDFLVPDHKLIIECDGLIWHSENYRDKKYHQEKLKAYEDLGYTALFFREDEILNSLPMVESIIKNKLGLSTKIYARKCVIGTTTKAFFTENHLMGKGKGKVFALLYEGEPVAALQACWRRKGTVLDISRFCTKKGVSVVGGFSKLLKAVEKEFQPKTIINYVDRRYGQGFHLEQLGFIKESENLSFRWCNNNQETHHRMKFPGKTGYDYGYSRIWDCGQAKYVKRVHG